MEINTFWVELSWVESLFNVYEMINNRNSLIAYIIIYKFIVHLVCDYNMGGGGYCTHDSLWDCFWCVYWC